MNLQIIFTSINTKSIKTIINLFQILFSHFPHPQNPHKSKYYIFNQYTDIIPTSPLHNIKMTSPNTIKNNSTKLRHFSVYVKISMTSVIVKFIKKLIKIHLSH